jgi:hypothetical protein
MSGYVALLDLHPGPRAPGNESIDLGQYKTIECSIRIHCSGAAGSIHIQEAAVDEELEYTSPGTSMHEKGNAILIETHDDQAACFASVPAPRACRSPPKEKAREPPGARSSSTIGSSVEYGL